MTDCCWPDNSVITRSSMDTGGVAVPSSPRGHRGDLASCVNRSPSSPVPIPSASSAATSTSASSSSSSAFSPRYALARRRRECLGLLESLRLSMNLSLKAITLLFCCVIMTVQYRAQQRRRAAAAASPSDEHQSASSASSAFSALFSATSKSSAPTLYQRLAVSNDASAEQIRAAHRRMAMRYHPDKLLAANCASASSTSVPSEQSGGGHSGGDGSSHDTFISIQEAYEVLSDPYERKRYDCALMTGMTYTRLPSALRNVHGRAAQQQQQEQDMAPFPAYVRRRPAAFTSTTHSADFHDNNRSSDRGSNSRSSSSSSSSSNTPQPVRASRSFSSIFSSPFVHVSPAPSTASATGTASPPYHSPASSPSSPSTSPDPSFSFLSPRSVPAPTTATSTPAAAAAPPATNSRRSAAPSTAAGATPSPLLAMWLADARSGVVSVVHWVIARLLILALLPLRVALVLLAVMTERKRRMDEDKQMHRRRVRDELSVGTYDWSSAAGEAQ